MKAISSSFLILILLLVILPGFNKAIGGQNNNVPRYETLIGYPTTLRITPQAKPLPDFSQYGVPNWKWVTFHSDGKTWIVITERKSDKQQLFVYTPVEHTDRTEDDVELAKKTFPHVARAIKDYEAKLAVSKKLLKNEQSLQNDKKKLYTPRYRKVGNFLDGDYKEPKQFKEPIPNAQGWIYIGCVGPTPAFNTVSGEVCGYFVVKREKSGTILHIIHNLYGDEYEKNMFQEMSKAIKDFELKELLNKNRKKNNKK